MTSTWTPQDTTSHQDHVIAHLVGATLRGYFVFEEALYVLLDIGFIWMILLDGEMGLLPHPVAVAELEMDAEAKAQIKADIDVLLGNGSTEALLQLTVPPVPCQINDVGISANAERRRLLITGETASLAIETSLSTATIQVYAI